MKESEENAVGNVRNLIVGIILAVIFFSLPDYKLIIGGIFFIYFGVCAMKRFDRDTNRFILVGGISATIIGLASIILQWAKPQQWKLTILVGLALFILFLASYYISDKKKNKLAAMIVVLLSTYIAFSIVYILNNLLNFIVANGIPDLATYVRSLEISLIAIIIFCFIFRYMFHFSTKHKENNYLYFSLSLIAFIIISGFFLVMKLPAEKQVAYFIGIISWAFFSGLVGAAALKQITTRHVCPPCPAPKPKKKAKRSKKKK